MVVWKAVFALVLFLVLSVSAESCCWCGKYYNSTQHDFIPQKQQTTITNTPPAVSAVTAVYASPKIDPYTTELYVTLIVRASVAAHQSVKLSCAATYGTTVLGLTTFTWDYTNPYKIEKIDFPLDDVPYGRSEILVELLLSGTVLATTKTHVTKLEHKDYVVKIDYSSHTLIVGGLPFLPFGFFHEFDVTADGPESPQTAALAEVVHGFNVFAIWTYVNASIPSQKEKLLAFMDQCTRVQAKVHILLLGVSELPDTPSKWAQISDLISAVGTHEALLAYFLADEPDGRDKPEWPALLQDVYDFIKSADPYHPITLNLNCMHTSTKWAPMADILMSDPYPIGLNNPVGCDECTGSVVDVATRFSTMNKDLYYMKPIWFIPQSFGNQEHWDREPTGREQEAMAYLSLIYGVTGIEYWIHTAEHPVSHGAWDRCAEMALEIAELTPVVSSHTVLQPATVHSTGVHYAAWQETNMGSAVILVVNPTTLSQDFEIYISSLFFFTGQARVMFENWKITITSGRFFDQLPPLGTRAYFLPLSQMSPVDETQILNPSFEYSHNSGLADSFFKVSPTYSLATTFADTRLAKHGIHSVRLVTADTAAPATIRSMNFIAKNDSFVSVYATGKPGLSFSICSSSTECEPFTLKNEGSDEWVQYTMEKPVIAGSKVTVYLVLNDVGYAWFDLFQMVSIA